MVKTDSQSLFSSLTKHFKYGKEGPAVRITIKRKSITVPMKKKLKAAQFNKLKGVQDNQPHGLLIKQKFERQKTSCQVQPKNIGKTISSLLNVMRLYILKNPIIPKVKKIKKPSQTNPLSKTNLKKNKKKIINRERKLQRRRLAKIFKKEQRKKNNVQKKNN